MAADRNGELKAVYTCHGCRCTIVGTEPEARQHAVASGWELYHQYWHCLQCLTIRRLMRRMDWERKKEQKNTSGR